MSSNRALELFQEPEGDRGTLEAAFASAGATQGDPFGPTIELDETGLELVKAPPERGKKPHSVLGWDSAERRRPLPKAGKLPVHRRWGRGLFTLDDHDEYYR